MNLLGPGMELWLIFLSRKSDTAQKPVDRRKKTVNCFFIKRNAV